MTKSIFSLLVLLGILCSGFSKRSIFTRDYQVKSFYADFKTPYHPPLHSDGDTMRTEYAGFLYFKQKDSIIDLEYYALFNNDIFEFFRGEATYQPMENGETVRLNEKLPILIKYSGQYYRIKTDVTLPLQSVPTRLYYGLADGFIYVLIEENILSMNPPTPVGYCYLLLKFKNKELVKQKQFYSAGSVELKVLIANWPK